MVIIIARWIIDQLILEHRLAIEMSSVRCLLEDPENNGWEPDSQSWFFETARMGNHTPKQVFLP